MLKKKKKSMNLLDVASYLVFVVCSFIKVTMKSKLTIHAPS